MVKQCLKITFYMPDDDSFLDDLVKKYARRLELEGVAQLIAPRQAEVVACGNPEAIELLIDAIYKGSSLGKPDSIEVEPFVREYNFRGVFRMLD
ncbi:MAG TPA: hypothetical protein VJ201_00115 [Candidatus Babeliales bacterium]|nr:hypothetical protein [Candidatus Babeliales bacterium]